MPSNLENILDHSFYFSPTSIETILFRLLCALALAIALNYARKCFVHTNYQSKKDDLIIICSGPIVTIILLGIGSSIPRAFGLFAALSIIRLRTPIKDTETMVFIFASVAIGICCGSGAISIAILGSAVLVGLFFTLSVIKRKNIDSMYLYSLTIGSTKPFSIDSEAFSLLSKKSSFEHISTHFNDLKYDSMFRALINKKDYKIITESLEKSPLVSNYELEKIVTGTITELS